MRTRTRIARAYRIARLTPIIAHALAGALANLAIATWHAYRQAWRGPTPPPAARSQGYSSGPGKF